MLTTTDMAVIVSPGQNEIEQMKKLGLDIEPHRKRMNESQPALDEKFKDTNDPLRLVFVCAMWLTGFDAPSCSTVYLDKPMRNHTLMQTIARANRVFPGKHSGVIVDYANVFASLEKALAIYGAGKGGAEPGPGQAAAGRGHCGRRSRTPRRSAPGHGWMLAAHRGAAARQHGAAGSGGGRHQRADRARPAAARLLWPRAAGRHPVSRREARPGCAGVRRARGLALRRWPRPSGPSSAPTRRTSRQSWGGITGLLDESITGHDDPRGRAAGASTCPRSTSRRSRKRFKESKHKNTDLEALKAAIRAKLDRLMRLNRTRADFAEKFEALIESYNAGSRSIEELFEELLKLSNSLNEEQERHVREKLTEEELVIFDILTRPAPELTHGRARRGEEGGSGTA